MSPVLVEFVSEAAPSVQEVMAINDLHGESRKNVNILLTDGFKLPLSDKLHVAPGVW